MPVRVNIDPNAIVARVQGAFNAGLETLSNEILADCNQYCKKDQNTLIMSSIVHSKPKDGKLIWDTPYAKRQYWEIETSLTPGRTWQWCETAKRKHLREWTELAERCIKENL